jgi:hypothetical protein
MKKNIIIAVMVALMIAMPMMAGWGTIQPRAKSLIVYGLAGTQPAYRLVRVDAAIPKVWDTSPGGLVTASTSWAETVIDLTDYTAATSMGGWGVTLPTPKELLDGQYDVLIYDIDDGAEAETDPVEIGYRCQIRNNQITEITDL